MLTEFGEEILIKAGLKFDEQKGVRFVSASSWKLARQRFHEGGGRNRSRRARVPRRVELCGRRRNLERR